MSFQSNTINVNEAARMLNVNPKTVRRYIEKGLLKAEKSAYGYLVREDDAIGVRDMQTAYRNIKNRKEIKEIYVINKELKSDGRSIEDVVGKFQFSF